MLPDLFAEDRAYVSLDPGAVLLGGFALAEASALIADIAAVAAQAPFRHLITPGGRRMSVAMTNCGALGWTSDAHGYRYATHDPVTRHPWPAMPGRFAALARAAAERAGYDGFAPDVCLINRYEPGARLSLHQDRDEGDMAAPIVSVSLGLSADFLWGGPARSDRPRRIALHHGDVVVWGGRSRLVFHGVDPVERGVHPDTDGVRYNMTFRKARN
jgi:alkylated DNA repair protein (DNA oxidative demethylase)